MSRGSGIGPFLPYNASSLEASPILWQRGRLREGVANLNEPAQALMNG